MTLREQFLALARLYVEARGITLVRLSSQMFNDGKKIPAVEDGSDLTTRRFEAGLQFMSDNWPDGVDWPEEVQRPMADGSGHNDCQKSLGSFATGSQRERPTVESEPRSAA